MRRQASGMPATRALFVGMVLVSVSLAGGSARGDDGIFSGSLSVAMEHTGGGAPAYADIQLQLPAGNWFSYTGVDVSNNMATICASYAFSHLEDDALGDAVDYMFPHNTAYNGVKLVITVRHGSRSNKLTKLVLTFKSGVAARQCKTIPLSKLEGATSVIFQHKAKKNRAMEGKLFGTVQVFRSFPGSSAGRSGDGAPGHKGGGT